MHLFFRTLDTTFPAEDLTTFFSLMQERLANREKMLQSREEAVQDALKFVQEQTLLREQGRMEQTLLQEQARMTIEAEARTQVPFLFAHAC